MNGPAPIVIAAGGTGGHMFPALAVAEVLRRRGRAVAMLTDARGARYAGNVPHHVIRAGSPTGSVATALSGMAALALGSLQSRAALRELRPAAAALFGGYAAVPAALAAMLRQTPYLVHEQNAVMGKANRLVARFGRTVALSFEHTHALPPLRARPFVTGNPVRPGFAAPRPPARADERFRILVLGGSQGARIFSDMLPATFASLRPGLRQRLVIAQQCRPEDLVRVREAYAGIALDVELASFFDDVPRRMALADLVIARSGASTIAEILALGRPSLLIPYPFAAEDHQTANAGALAEAGAALLVHQSEASAGRIAAAIEALMLQPMRLATMREAAAALARPDAADQLADAVLTLAHGDQP